MDKVDVLIKALEPAIDVKCAQIRQKKSDKTLTGVFLTVSLVMLIVPALLVFWGINLCMVLLPLLFFGAVLLTASPFLMSKGVKSYE